MVDLTPDERAAALRFCETCEDGQEYNVPIPMMRRLEQLGLVVGTRRALFTQTEDLVRMFDAGELNPTS